MNIKRNRLSTIPNTSIRALLFKWRVSPPGRQHRSVVRTGANLQFGFKSKIKSIPPTLFQIVAMSPRHNLLPPSRRLLSGYSRLRGPPTLRPKPQTAVDTVNIPGRSFIAVKLSDRGRNLIRIGLRTGAKSWSRCQASGALTPAACPP